MDTVNREKDIIVGRNPVLEALKAQRNIDTIYMANGDSNSVTTRIKSLAKKAGLICKEATNQKLDFMCGGVAHQGVLAVCACGTYVSVEDILKISQEKGTSPFIIIADEVEDPHNLGALIRTAEAVGADGLIIPKRRSASLSPTVYKTSAGAASIFPVSRVSNLVSVIKDLKKQNIWVYGADMDGKNYSDLDYSGGVAIVIGAEGNGIGRLIRDECDFISSMPMNGKINSLNASVAGGIIMYEVLRQRMLKA